MKNCFQVLSTNVVHPLVAAFFLSMDLSLRLAPLHFEGTSFLPWLSALQLMRSKMNQSYVYPPFDWQIQLSWDTMICFKTWLVKITPSILKIDSYKIQINIMLQRILTTLVWALCMEEIL